METSEGRSPQEGAEAARKAGQEIADLVYEKQLAYGDSSGIQHEIWKVLLRQYECSDEMSMQDGIGLGGHYLVPIALMDHIPRLTRVFDRICRIVSNPAVDRMGEDPWRDLVGDAICGVIMPRTRVVRGGVPETLILDGEPSYFETDLPDEFRGEGRWQGPPPNPTAEQLAETRRQLQRRVDEFLGRELRLAEESGGVGNDDPHESQVPPGLRSRSEREEAWSGKEKAAALNAFDPNVPHPRETRVWNEEEEKRRAEEHIERQRARSEADESIADYQARKDRLVNSNGDTVQVPPVTIQRSEPVQVPEPEDYDDLPF